MADHCFGGNWTTDKLERVRKYLEAYMTIFSGNERARKLTPIYVDAFAGTGYRTPASQPPPDNPLFPELEEPETEAFLKGSARIALEVEPPFKRYLFIERDPERAKELEKLANEFRIKGHDIEVVETDANQYLIQWCHRNDWRYARAAVFLDPYGMQVSWDLIEALGQTQAVDLWLLFPLGMAVNRLLTRNQPPTGAWAHALTRMFGTNGWEKAFYAHHTQMTLFGKEEEYYTKEADL
ncbi:MAG: three-Cys-motif partner protein TcmP [Roseiflexus sp.]|nr:three-Cys-motif partner protein TcmP [Roseiflexus sp.]